MSRLSISKKEWKIVFDASSSTNRPSDSTRCSCCSKLFQSKPPRKPSKGAFGSIGAPLPPPNPPNPPKPPPRCARAVAASATIPAALSARVNPFGLIAPHSFLAFELANGPGLHGQVDEEPLHLLLVLRRVHPGLAQ